MPPTRCPQSPDGRITLKSPVSALWNHSQRIKMLLWRFHFFSPQTTVTSAKLPLSRSLVNAEVGLWTHSQNFSRRRLENGLPTSSLLRNDAGSYSALKLAERQACHAASEPERQPRPHQPRPFWMGVTDVRLVLLWWAIVESLAVF